MWKKFKKTDILYIMGGLFLYMGSEEGRMYNNFSQTERREHTAGDAQAVIRKFIFYYYYYH